MAPIASLLSAALAVTSPSQTYPQPWHRQTTTSTGSYTTPSMLVFKAGPKPVELADTTTSQTTVAASTLLSLSATASSAAEPTTNPSLELRDSSSVCGEGFVSCTSPGGIVCVASASFDLVPGASCKIFSLPASDSLAASSALQTTPTSAPAIPAVVTTPATQSSAAPDKIQNKPTAPIDWDGYPAASTSTSKAINNIQYSLFTGNGSTFPDSSAWISSFDDMWDLNMKNLNSKVCDQWGANSDAESATLKSAIQSAATSSKLDPRFILALVMQESRGCVRVGSTMGAHNNPGLLQDYDGPNSCNMNGTTTTPCPDDTITGMINDGVFGNQGPGKAKGVGLMQDYENAGGMKPVSDAARYYIAARIYNSGSYVDDNMGCGVATHCYSSDVANRLIGYTGDETPCQPEKVAANCPASSSS